jgi:hypothetical protein
LAIFNEDGHTLDVYLYWKYERFRGMETPIKSLIKMQLMATDMVSLYPNLYKKE